MANIKDTNAKEMKPKFQLCFVNVKVDTPMYVNTKFSIRKFASSNN